VTRHLEDIGPWRVPKSGHLTITKVESLHIDTHRKIHWFQKFILVDLRQKITKILWKKPFKNSGVTRRLWRFQHATVLEQSIRVRFSLILSIYKVVYISIKDLHPGYAATCWRNLLSNLTKKLNYIAPLITVKMPPITLVNAWPSWIDAHCQYVLLVTLH